MSYRDEFPEFDPAAMPAIPIDWEDTSWHNDAMPSFRYGRLCIWIDWIDPKDSDFPQSRASGKMKRFQVTPLEDDGMHPIQFGEMIMESDDWSEVLSFVANFTFEGVA